MRELRPGDKTVAQHFGEGGRIVSYCLVALTSLEAQVWSWLTVKLRQSLGTSLLHAGVSGGQRLCLLEINARSNEEDTGLSRGQRPTAKQAQQSLGQRRRETGA